MQSRNRPRSDRSFCGLLMHLMVTTLMLAGLSRVALSSPVAPSAGGKPSRIAQASPIGPGSVAPTGCNDEMLRRSTAVTLNYCRASFHRIQKSPNLRVLIEEQEKILNNLDLNGIADQDVVKLYAAVLVEISEMRLSDRERLVVQDRYRASLGTVLTADAFDFGSQVASAHYLAAVRTGARSWWDYRNVATARDTDVFHVDQKRLMAFTEKSAQFLDTFWKLARDRKIPDRWLVRNQDLEKLDSAMLENHLAVRHRVLKRMEEFMCCYPPYWYYLGRTEQALGQLSTAERTYEKLMQVGQGHFRKDDMLAAGLANRAVIQSYLKQPGAADTAIKALGHSSDAWEANLMCAYVLGSNGRPLEAEDAILRNLDVGLEREQSSLALTALYVSTANVDKLRERLADPSIVRRLPVPLLIRAANVLGPQNVPETLVGRLASSLAAHYELAFGPDDFVLITAPQWNLQSSEMSLIVGDEAHRHSTIALMPGRSEVRFARIGEFGHLLRGSAIPPNATLVVRYPGTPIVHLRLDRRAESASNGATLASFPVVDMFGTPPFSGRRYNLVLVSIEIGETNFPIVLLPGVSHPTFREAIESGPSPPSNESPIPRGIETPPKTDAANAAQLKTAPADGHPTPPLLAVPKPPASPSPPVEGPKFGS